jgi:glycosyltransferase involved in cell wall biosynthesis
MARRTILHLIDTGGPGGAETVYSNLAAGLEVNGWRSVTVVPEIDWLAATLSEGGLAPILADTHGAYDVRYIGKLARLVLRERPAIIQTHLFTTAAYGCLVGAMTGVPVVCTFHGQVDVQNDGLGNRLKLSILRRRAARVIFVSSTLRAEMSQRMGIPPLRSRVIHNGVDVRVWSPTGDVAPRRDFGAGPDEILIGALGNVRPAKDYATFIRAAAILAERSARYRFVIIGDTTSPLLPGLQQLQEMLGLRDRLVFAGFRSDAAAVLRSLDAFVLSSTSEGFSLATAEAMACGIPVVATRCGGPAEIIDDGVNGTLVPVGMPDRLADALERVMVDAQHRAEMTAAALETVRTQFSQAAMIRAYEEEYMRVLEREPGAQ